MAKEAVPTLGKRRNLRTETGDVWIFGWKCRCKGCDRSKPLNPTIYQSSPSQSKREKEMLAWGPGKKAAEDRSRAANDSRSSSTSSKHKQACFEAKRVGLDEEVLQLLCTRWKDAEKQDQPTSKDEEELASLRATVELLEQEAKKPGSCISKAFLERERAKREKLEEKVKGKSGQSDRVRKAMEMLKQLKEIDDPSEAITRNIEKCKVELQAALDSEVKSPSDQLRSAEAKLANKRKQLEATKARGADLRNLMADMAKQLEENDAAELAGQEEVAAAEVEHLQKRQAIAVPQSATLVQAVGMERMGTVLAGFRDTVNKPSFLKEATPQYFHTMVEALFSAFNGLQHPGVAC